MLFAYIGLRYEDLLCEQTDPAVKEALELASPEVLAGRLRRQKRASDLSLKGKVFTDYIPSHVKLDPFKSEIYDDVERIRARNKEAAILDMHKR